MFIIRRILMKKRVIWFVFLCAMAVLNFNACTKNSPTQSENEFWEQIDQFVTDRMDPNGAGFGVLVIKDGEVAFGKGWGMANIANNVEFTDNTPTDLASLTKQFTAAAILILYEREMLSLDARVINYFPEMPAEWSEITIHHLLTHQSGIPNYTDFLNEWADYDGMTNEQVFDLALQRNSLDFTPGNNSSYSNTGYIILALLIERITEMTYHEFLNENIFSPLEMTATFVGNESAEFPSGIALSYDEYNRPYNYRFYTYGSGGIYSTLNDMFKWDQALYTEQLLNQATLQMAFTGYTGGENDYGYGWMVGSHSIFKSVRHGGYSMGNLNYIYRIPDPGFTYLFLSNGGVFANNGFDTWTTELQQMIFDHYL
jgi:CubicO group peptidase (beta-lactamase class C family)